MQQFDILGYQAERSTLPFVRSTRRFTAVEARDTAGHLIATLTVTGNGDGSATLSIAEAEMYGTGERTWGRYAWTVRTLGHLATILACYRGSMLETHAEAVITAVSAFQERAPRR